jgi:hypothetical protein
LALLMRLWMLLLLIGGIMERGFWWLLFVFRFVTARLPESTTKGLLFFGHDLAVAAPMIQDLRE